MRFEARRRITQHGTQVDVHSAVDLGRGKTEEIFIFP